MKDVRHLELKEYILINTEKGSGSPMSGLDAKTVVMF